MSKKSTKAVKNENLSITKPSAEQVEVKGARVHNLKNLDVSIPKNSLVICCGVSGSGKSSLAFDTIFAEGQRRYVESLSSYARQFLGQMDKPDVDSITGLSPAVSIDQKNTSHNPRSTVGTVTEIWDHLRLLYARIGVSHCPECGTLLKSYSSSSLLTHLLEKFNGSQITIMAPVISQRKGSHEQLLSEYATKGFTRVEINGEIFRLDELNTLDKRKKHDISLVIDKVLVSVERKTRILDDIDLAYSMSEGLVCILIGEERLVFSRNYSCPKCLVGYSKLEPKDFSFNSPSGACEVCDGLGYSMKVDLSLVVENPNLTISQGALTPWFESSGKDHFSSIAHALLVKYGVSAETEFKDIPKEVSQKLLYGDSELKVKANFAGRDYITTFEGVVTWVERRVTDPWGESNKEKMEGYFSREACSACKGGRLNSRAQNVLIKNESIIQLASKTINVLDEYIKTLELKDNDLLIANRVLKEITERVGFLKEVGLGYLSLDRSANSLSGGEAQRIRLASQIGSGLTGVLYVLDEPSIGLHQKDNMALIATLEKLKQLGNTVLVVEHDEETIRHSDYVVEIGPAAGVLGGELVYSGSLVDFLKTETLTSNYLSGKLSIPTPESRRALGNGKITLKGCNLNNLKNVTAEIPLKVLNVITGVSGSGKSTLINDILAYNMKKVINKKNQNFKYVKSISGYEDIDKIVIVDQSPIGRTPRSNPASYIGLYDKIRELFVQLPQSQERGWKVGRFSFNVPARNGGGHCENCQGQGLITIEMSFLPDIHVPCDQCKGQRFTKETLEVKFKGKSIADVLEMNVSTAKAFFESVSSLSRHLKTLEDVGLGYIKLGQTATTLSGGEAQRVKLASELLKRNTGRTLYILDEPSTGLHFEDVSKLVKVLEKLVDAGNTMIVIEHNLDIIRRADHVIDLGPEGGPKGGVIVGKGTPEHIASLDTSTGKYLKIALESQGKKDKYLKSTT